MRARSLKPSVFLNDKLGNADPLYTVIFAGCWCLADREGRLEDRPLRIHASINPFRPLKTTVRALNWLVDHGFLKRYGGDITPCLYVINFRRHQRPHDREAPSRLPAPSTESNQEDKPTTGTTKDPHKDSPSLSLDLPDPNLGHGEAALTPDSGLRTPDSPFRTPDSGPLTPDSEEPEPSTRLERRGATPPLVSKALRRLATDLKPGNGAHGSEPKPESPQPLAHPQPEPETLAQKARILSGAGQSVGDIVKTLQQYSVTAEQVSAWLEDIPF